MFLHAYQPVECEEMKKQIDIIDFIDFIDFIDHDSIPMIGGTNDE